jgi:hypothetical protein
MVPGALRVFNTGPTGLEIKGVAGDGVGDSDDRSAAFVTANDAAGGVLRF